MAPEQEYPYKCEYTNEENWQITPDELVRWLGIKTVGTTNWSEPNVAICLVLVVCANTMAFWKKKSILFHEPDCLQGWLAH